MQRRQVTRAALVAAALATAGVACPAWAIDKHWNSGTALWGNSSAWNLPGVPGSGDIVYVDFFSGGNPGIATVNQPQTSPVSVHVLNGDTLRVVDGAGVIGGGFGPEATDGAIGAGGDFIVGFQGTHGTLSMSHTDPIGGFDGQITVGATMRVGMDSGIGTVLQSAGLVTVGQRLRVADSNSGEFIAAGTYNMSGGSLTTTALEVGYGRRDSTDFTNMQGTFNLTGGFVTTGTGNTDVQIGGSGSNGVFNQSGGTFFCQFRQLDLARSNGLGGTAVVNYSGGSFNTQGIVFSNGNATVNYNNGAHLHIGQLVMAGGHFLLAAGHNKTLGSGNVFIINDSAVLDLNDNSMVAAQFSTVAGGLSLISRLRLARNGGAWNGNGITSTAARLDGTHRTALGYAQATEVLTPSGGVYSFHGESIFSGSTLVKYTYYGDSDLDGDADGVDIGRWATNFTGELGGGASATRTWFQGDWDYDGDVDGADAGLWATAFTGELGGGGLGSLVLNDPTINPQAAAILGGLGITVVPEPTLASVALLCLAGLRRSRSRHHKESTP